ncbi:MAG: sulfotransferase [Caldilineaceae bacterium]
MIINNYALSLRNSCAIRLEQLWADLYQYVPLGTRRRFQVYCIGMPRSGTHSIAAMFAKHYTSLHEPAYHDTIVHLLNYLHGGYSGDKLKTLLIARDRYLRLEMESSHVLHHLTNSLVSLFPDAQFILTIREPLSWLESEINQNLITQRWPVWKSLEQYRYGRYHHSFQPEEKALAMLDNVYPIRSYLAYWREHYLYVKANVPQERLLILKTSELYHSASTLAAFLGIQPQTIDLAHAHAGVNNLKPFRLYQYVRKDFIQEQVDECCGEIVRELFPGCRSVNR